MSKAQNLGRLLKQRIFPSLPKKKSDQVVAELQREIVGIQRGIWNLKGRVVIVLEGFDAAGKGGVIRRLSEKLDPRGIQVHPIGPPERHEQEKHYLYRFWSRLPSPGKIAVFDRSWYGRVLVEKVEELAEPPRLKQAYREINEFERMLTDDGIQVIKLFLAISADEQLRRFEERLKDPYKQWKLTPEDMAARKRWNDYVKAVDEMLRKTDTKQAPWHLIPADDKPHARVEALKIITRKLKRYGSWMESAKRKKRIKSLNGALRRLSQT